MYVCPKSVKVASRLSKEAEYVRSVHLARPRSRGCAIAMLVNRRRRYVSNAASSASSLDVTVMCFRKAQHEVIDGRVVRTTSLAARLER